MRNLEQLITFVDQSVLDTIRTSRDKLLAYAGIKVDILEFTGVQLRIRVEQVELKNNWMLNQRQLVSRAGAIFEPLNRKFRLHFVPLTYSPDWSKITGPWIEEKMQELGLSRKDMEKQLNIDKSTLSHMFGGSKDLTKFHKATFFYYLLTYEINRDLRESLGGADEETPIVSINGPLAESNALYYDGILSDIANKHEKVIIDFSGCDYINSAGLGVLVTYIGKFNSITIQNLSDELEKLFDSLGLGAPFNFRSNSEES